MLVSDIKSRVKRQFGDEAAVQVTDADILRWINDGLRDIVMKNEGVLETSSTTATVASQQDYTLPTNLLVLRNIRYKRLGDLSFYKLVGMSLSEFDEYIDGWEGTAYGPSTPVVYTVYGGALKLFPIPQLANETIKLVYSRVPVDVTADGDTPDLPLPYHNAIVDYCLQKAYELDEDWGSADNIAADYDAKIRLNKERESWQHREHYPNITVIGDDYW